MKKIIFLATLCSMLTACGTFNATVGGLEVKAAGDYATAKKNIQVADDMKLTAWVDSACAMNVGALQRAVSASGNPHAVNAVFTACPVPGVGITSNMPNGSMNVQTTVLQAPTPPAQ